MLMEIERWEIWSIDKDGKILEEQDCEDKQKAQYYLCDNCEL